MRQKNNFYSYVSLWEMAIKSSLGKLQLLGPSGQHTSAKQFLLHMVRELQLSALPLEFDDLAGSRTCRPIIAILLIDCS